MYKISELSLFSAKFLFCFFFLISEASYSQSKNGKYQGLLWEISGKDMKKSSYLYGTMHVSNKVAFHLSDTFFIALKNSDMVALEINPETLLVDFIASPIYSDSRRMEDMYNADFYLNAFKAGEVYNEGLAGILSKESDFANYLLYRSESRKENFEENTYLDMFIFQAGKKLNKKIIGLENVNTTLELSFKASIAEAEADDDDHSSYSYKRDVYGTVEDAYRKGDLDLIDSLGDIMYSKSYREYMLYLRNEIMAVRMDSLIRTNASLFTGVGAAHLPGEKGVIELMRLKGYTVRPVQHNERLSSKMKDKIENNVYKVSYTSCFSKDSIFQVSLPGEMLSLSSLYSDPYSRYSGMSSQDYFCPEVVNGAYYSVTRINTFAPLYNLNQKGLCKKIDSLLFENIPGKIIRKKEIIENDYPGFEIVSRTRRGDVNHYKILVTPLEILVFKVSGERDFVEKESAKFINSIKFSPENTNVRKKVYGPSNTFSVFFPGDILSQDNTGSNNPQQMVIQSYNKEEQEYFLCIKASLHDYEYIEEDSFELDHLSKMFYEQFDYELDKKTFFNFNNSPAIDVLLKEQNKTLRVRLVIAGTNYYLLASTTEKEEKWIDFANSLQLMTPLYSMPFQEYVDSIYCFKVKTPVKPLGHAFNFSDMTKMKSEKEKNKQYKSKQQSFSFISDATSEAIRVEYEKFHDFNSFETRKDFWASEIKRVTEEGYLMIARRESAHSDRLSLLLTDTNSTRAIKVNLYWKEGVVYRVLANIDTLSEESQFVKTFFDTFTPLDTLIGVSVLTDKPEKFFDALESNDSVKAVQALNSIQVLRFKDKDAEKIIHLLDTYNFSKVLTNYTYHKERLIIELSALKSEKIIPFLTKQYINSGDTASYQIAVLKTLAKLKTEISYKTIAKLLNEEVPLTKESEVRPLFSAIDDSLELAVVLFPDLLKFTRYQEYKSEIYRLLYMLVDSGLVTPNVYVSYKAEILREANEEVRRKAAKEISSATSDYRNNSYSYEYGSLSSRNANSIEIFSTLLMPFYDDVSINSYFSRLDKIKDKDLNLRISLLLLKNNKQISDTVWLSFSMKDDFRLQLYKELKTIGKLEKFDPAYTSQEAISKALLYDNAGFSEKDSVVLLDKRSMTYNGKKGYVYFFKSKKEKSKSWKLDYVGLQPADSTQFEIDNILVLKKGSNLPDKEVQEYIDEQVEKINLIGRKRVGNYYHRENFFYDSDHY